MFDWNQFLAYAIPIIGGPSVLGVLVNSILKRRRGALTRASLAAADLTKLERDNTRQFEYILQLRADAIAAGKSPRAWPRGMKPKG